MGLSFGSNKSKQAAGEVKVWKPAEPFLIKGMKSAAGMFDQSAGTQAYQGDTYAGADPGMLEQFLTGAQRFSNDMGETGKYLAGQARDAIGLGTGSALGDYMNDLQNKQGALQAGNSYATSPIADGLIDATNRDVTRGLVENDLPQARLAAIGSGNSGSSRLGAREAILQRGAEDRMADTSASIRGSLFDRGTNDYNTNISARGNQLAQLFNQGLSGLGQSSAMGQQGMDARQLAMGIDQGNRQGYTDQNVDRFDRNDNRTFDLLNRYWSIVGGNLGQGTAGASKSSGFNAGVRLV